LGTNPKKSRKTSKIRPETIKIGHLSERPFRPVMDQKKPFGGAKVAQKVARELPSPQGDP
jgi:hypothetical protein